MPLPSPKGKQSEQSFVSKCMADPTMLKEYKDQKQRAAICYSQYKRAKKRKQAKGSQEEPQWEDQMNNGFLIIETN